MHNPRNKILDWSNKSLLSFRHNEMTNQYDSHYGKDLIHLKKWPASYDDSTFVYTL